MPDYNRLLADRVLALTCLVFVALASGTPYLYGFYLPQLVAHCNLAASDSALLSLACNAGVGFGGFPAGIAIDTYGPRISILLGAICVIAGYYGLYRAYLAQASSMLPLCCSMALVGFGCIMSYFATLKAAQSNFPAHRGAASAFPVSAYGLSATVFSAVGAAYFHSNTAGFLLFLCLFTGSVILFCSFLVNIHLADVDAAVLNDLESELVGPDSRVAPVRSRAPSLAGSFSFWGLGKRNTDALLLESGSASSDSLSPNHSGHAPLTTDLDPIQTPSNSDPGPWEIFKDRIGDGVFLTHLSIVSLICGIGQMYIYSVGFVAKAQVNYGQLGDGAPPLVAASTQAVQVSIISIGSFSGRLLSGFLSDHIHKYHNVLRLWLVLVVALAMAATQLLVAYNKNSVRLMSVSSAIIGVCYGMVYGTYPAIIADTYGTKTFTSNWGLICVGPLIVLFALNKTFGHIYDAHSARKGLCFAGNGCYMQAFELGAVLCVLLFLVAATLMYVQRKRTLLM